MAFKIFEAFKAPPNWYFVDPDTGHEYYAGSKPELISKIVAYRTQNNLPEIFQLGHVVENWLCGRPENLGKCRKNSEMHRSWWTTVKGGIALLVNMLIKKPVDQAEADRRSWICTKCKYNVFPDKGRFVAWSDKVAEASVPGKKSKFHSQLGNCKVCTCVLKAKVFAPGPFDLTEDEKAKMREVGCWQVED